MSSISQTDKRMQSRFQTHTVTGDNTAARTAWSALRARGVPAKLLVVARHGQGHHNVAESQYGTTVWEQHWALKTGDGTAHWEDSYLTEQGIKEVQHTGRTELSALVDAHGYPDVFYCSPLRRCMQTLLESWGQTAETGKMTTETIFDVHVTESIRETLGRHTCDKRVPHSMVVDEFGHMTPMPANELKLVRWVFDPKMAEEDEMWDAEHRETDLEIDARIAQAVDRILDGPEEYVSVTCHSGVIASMLRVLSHAELAKPATGSCLFMVVAMR